MGKTIGGIPALLEMLTYKRPAWSSAEREFIRRFVAPTGAVPDAFGNYVLQIGESPVLWSAHTDTVHRTEGRQRLYIHKNIAHVAGRAEVGSCLGADDTTGVWLLTEMIKAEKPGLYVFHRAEEIGCQGSMHIRKNTPTLLDGIRFAIAFDRKGTDSIITHQMGLRTASDVFAQSLAAGLGMDMKLDSFGVYTDTECYSDMVAECTNVSVGYESAHTPYEQQDLSFAKKLRDALMSLDTDTLVEGEWQWTYGDTEGEETAEESDWYTVTPTGYAVYDMCGVCGVDMESKGFNFGGIMVCNHCYNGF